MIHPRKMVLLIACFRLAVLFQQSGPNCCHKPQAVIISLQEWLETFRSTCHPQVTARPVQVWEEKFLCPKVCWKVHLNKCSLTVPWLMKHIQGYKPWCFHCWLTNVPGKSIIGIKFQQTFVVQNARYNLRDLVRKCKGHSGDDCIKTIWKHCTSISKVRNFEIKTFKTHT